MLKGVGSRKKLFQFFSTQSSSTYEDELERIDALIRSEPEEYIPYGEDEDPSKRWPQRPELSVVECLKYCAPYESRPRERSPGGRGRVSSTCAFLGVGCFQSVHRALRSVQNAQCVLAVFKSVWCALWFPGIEYDAPVLIYIPDQVLTSSQTHICRSAGGPW